MNFNKSNITLIIGLIIGVFGILGPIIYDSYKFKSELQIKVLDQSIIIEKPYKLDSLIISYKEENLDELSMLTFSIANTGR